MSWLDGPMLGFDTETTGVSTTRDRIVTAALITRTGEATSAHTWLINPGVPIPEGATAVHGITTERAQAEGAAPEEALAQIADALTGALAAGIPVVGFNAQFDLSILETELVRHGLSTLSERLPRGIRPVVDPLVLDRHLEKYRKGTGARKLFRLLEAYGVSVDVDSLHAADADVIATLDLLAAMARRFPSIGEVELDSLHDLQISAHRTWATEFSAWLTSRGSTGDLPDPAWPVALAPVTLHE